ncbi:MAG: MBL fold metallo-hydrolase, partial [Anaerolineales bacterium]|nr:MBL fold metallo-hydrolase [Anaerolineales bacterium]
TGRMTTPSPPTLHCLPLPTPFSVGDVNVYLLESDGCGGGPTLLDTGPLWKPAETALRQGLAALGYAVSDLERIIISHPHADHYGLAGKLAAESSARVLAHPSSRATLEQGSATNRRATRFYREWFTRSGVPPQVQEAIAQAKTATRQYARPVQMDGEVNDGDRLRMGGYDWETMLVPGHSGGLICFYEPETGVLLASDHLIADISSNPVVEPPPDGESGRPKRLLQYLQQLERVASLRPAVAYSGHGQAITDVCGLVKTRIAFHHQRADQVWEHLVERPATLFELAGKLFSVDLPPVHLFLALSEVQGHLDMLEDAGRARCSTDGPVCCWTAEPIAN